MSSWLEPQRITDGREEPSDLASAIRELRAQRPSLEEIVALARRLEPQLTAASSPAARIQRIGAGAAARWLATMLVVTGISTYATITLWHGWHAQAPAAGVPAGGDRVPRVTSAPTAAQTRQRAEPPPAPEPEIVAPSPTLSITAPESQVPAPQSRPELPRRKPEATALPRRTHGEHAASRAATRAPQPTAAEANPDAELDLLQRAHTALEAHPLQALELTEQHLQVYPRGLFAQEREVLAIEALLALSRKPAAVARARAFLAQYPTSPHARRVRPLLERARSTTTSGTTDHP